MEIRSEPYEDQIGKGTLFIGTRDGMTCKMAVPQEFVDDPSFPLDEFLRREMGERFDRVERDGRPLIG